jgi:hypothetical protein
MLRVVRHGAELPCRLRRNCRIGIGLGRLRRIPGLRRAWKISSLLDGSRADVIEYGQIVVQSTDLQNSPDWPLRSHEDDRAAEQPGASLSVDEDGDAAGVHKLQPRQIKDEAPHGPAIQDRE